MTSEQVKENKVHTLYAEELEEAILQYLVTQHGMKYGDLVNNKIKLEGLCPECMATMKTDFKCARAIVTEGF